MTMRSTDLDQKCNSDGSGNSATRPDFRNQSLQLISLVNSFKQWFIEDPAFTHSSILDWFEHSLERKKRFISDQDKVSDLKDAISRFREIWEANEDIQETDIVSSNFQDETEEIRYRLTEKDIPASVSTEIKKIVDQADETLDRSDRRLVDFLLETPWGQTDPPTNWTVDEVQEKLDASHYGLHDLKNRILKHLAVLKRAPDSSALRICLVGPPGTGKTTIAQTIAEAIGRHFIRLSLGGLRDETEIIGLKRSWKNSEPGQIVKRLMNTDTLCPLFLLDEVDKLNSTPQRDPTGAILQLLDPEQNTDFQDNFLEHGLNLSNALFVATANDRNKIPDPLQDRLEFVEFHGYGQEEKYKIAKEYVLPTIREELKLQENELNFQGNSLWELIEEFTSTPGIRELKNRLLTLAREAVRIDGNLDVTASNLTEYLSDDANKTRIGF